MNGLASLNFTLVEVATVSSSGTSHLDLVMRSPEGRREGGREDGGERERGREGGREEEREE